MVAESIMEHTTTEESTMVIKMGMCFVFCYSDLSDREGRIDPEVSIYRY